MLHRPRPAPPRPPAGDRDRWRAGVAVPEPARPPPRPTAGMAAGREWGTAAVENVVTVFSRLFSASWGLPHRRPPARGVPDPARRPRNPIPGRDPRTAHQPPRARPRHHPPPPQRTSSGPVGQVNAELARYWRWFASLSDPARAQVTAPLLNKLRALLLRPFARAAARAADPPPQPHHRARPRRDAAGADPERRPRGGDHPPGRLPDPGPDLAGRHRPRPPPPSTSGRTRAS